MSELEEKLGAILKDPGAMEQIMGMAKLLSQPAQEAPKEPVPPPESPGPDPGLIRALGSLAGKGGIDRNQQSLLCALGPYLSRDRLQRLERAMGAAKMATAASMFLNAGGLRAFTGR